MQSWQRVFFELSHFPPILLAPYHHTMIYLGECNPVITVVYMRYSWNLMKVTHLFKMNIFILSLDMPLQSHENKNYRQKIVV